MCVNFTPPTRQQLRDHFGVEPPEFDWKPDTWQDYLAPVIIDTGTGPFAFLASYGFIPKRHQPAGKHYTTMNARAETVGQLRSYRAAWQHSQLCLVPMQAFVEPSYETGKNVWTRIGMASGEPFAVAGMWRSWREDDGSDSYSFTQLTINADDHPLMKRMHKPGDEKRSLVIIPPEHYGDWLRCKSPNLAAKILIRNFVELKICSTSPV